MKTLLGHLSQFSSFTSQGELLCTQGLTFLLRNREAAGAFTRMLGERSSAPLNNALTWRTEHAQADQRRPDLEGLNEDGSVSVKIEAKLGAPFAEGQLESYLADLGERGAGLLVLLVPQYRLDESTRLARETLAPEDPKGEKPTDGLPGRVVVISWSDALAALTGIGDPEFQLDLRQFRELYESLAGSRWAPGGDSALRGPSPRLTPLVPPFERVEELKDWRARSEDLLSLLDQLSIECSGDGRLNPVQGSIDSNPPFRYRYSPLPEGRSTGPCYALGVGEPQSALTTPLWLFLHRDTPEFEHLAARLRAASIDFLEAGPGGHLWSPLQVPIGKPNSEMVRLLMEDIRSVERAIYRD